MTKVETGQLLSMLRAVWSTEEITPQKIEVYHWVLRDYDFEDLKAAVMTYIGRGKFFPKPAELLELVKADQPELDSKLYQHYSRLRRVLQTGELSDQQSRELARIERKLGIPIVTDRPVPLRAVSG